MLSYFGMEKEAEEAQGKGAYAQVYDSFDPSLIPDSEKAFLLWNDNRSVARRPDRDDVTDTCCSNMYMAGTPHTWRLTLTSLEAGQRVRNVCVSFLPEEETDWSGRGCVRLDLCRKISVRCVSMETMISKSLLTDDGDIPVLMRFKTNGMLVKNNEPLPGSRKSMFENAIIDLSVDSDGAMTLQQEGNDTRWVCGSVPTTPGGSYKLSVYLVGLGTQVSFNFCLFVCLFECACMHVSLVCVSEGSIDRHIACWWQHVKRGPADRECVFS